MPQPSLDDAKEQVRQAADIVDLVSRYIPLKRSGRNFMACCPFHREKTPSFSVRDDIQRWKCFGCGKSGDVFGFVMEREGISFPEALRMLAEEHGIAVGRSDPGAQDAQRAREAALQVTEFACSWFQGHLKGSPAADYLKARQLTGETALAWRLGYAPDGWDGLLEAAVAAGHTVEALESAGLVVPRRNQREGERGYYDRFRDRVMFPIADVRGRVVAFGARALGDDEPKYLNSPETLLFHKGKVLYGLDRARDEVQRQRRLCVMEGYMDVIMAHQHGIETAVACLGTAFTPDHASIMRRFADRIELVYDSDQAGRRAADRALEVLLAENVEGFVAILPEGVDPCDLLVRSGAEALQAALDDAREVFEHLLTEAAARHDLSTVGGATAASDAILRAVIKVPHDVKRGLMIRRTAQVLGVEESRVLSRAKELGGREVVSRRGTPKSRDRRAPPPPPPPETPGFEPESTPDIPWDDPSTAPSRELLLLEAALTGSKLAGRLATEAPPDSFSSRTLARIARAVAATAREDGSADPAACAAAVDADGLADVVVDLVTRGAEMPVDVLQGQFEDCLRGQSLERRLDEARRRFSEARRDSDREQEDHWLAALNRLQAERSESRRSGQRRE